MEYIKSASHYVVRLDKGDEIISSISEICSNENIKAGIVNGIGAANEIEIGIFDTESKKYLKKVYTGDFEISALAGNISRMDEKPYLHLHITIGNPIKNIVAAGHMNRCVISATSEIYVTAVDTNVDRLFSNEVGLNLMKF